MRLSTEILQWFAQYRSLLRLDLPALDRRVGGLQDEQRSAITVQVTRSIVEQNRTAPPPPSALQKRLDWIARTLKLDSGEAACVGALIRLTQLEPFQSFSNAASQYFEKRDEASADLVGSLVGLQLSKSQKLFHRHGNLMQLGIVEDRGGRDIAPSDMLLKVLRQRTSDPRALEDVLLGGTPTPTLNLSDFDHLGRERDDVVAILRGCLDRRIEGAGILFYGPPGTGKTEFATLLGKACDARIIFAGEMDAERSEPDRSDRIAHLALISAIGKRAGRVIVVVDEADDIFTGVDEEKLSNRTGSKVFINRLVEHCSVPIIWITNNPQRLGEAVIRRMLRAIEFRKPGMRSRRRIVDRNTATLDLGIDEAYRAKLAQLPASPAVLTSAMRATSLCSGDGETALNAALSLQKAMGRLETVREPPSTSAFDAALSTADADLVEIERSVTRVGAGALSFLFTGLPGTGKSAFARHLAGSLEMEILEKRASDLLGMFVGESEAKIAQAFEEAADTKSFLIFDEVDSLLLDRRNALRSWEVSQVNEMLTWMERHPFPFAATSNLAERLDQAVQRRFTFKVKFNAMTDKQIELAFQHYFELPAPRELLRVHPLTPGDFSVVAKRAGIIGVRDANALAAMLEMEVSSKPTMTRHIGF